jgi:basic amino acid/polyamine antiporter, APA family
MPPIQPVEQPTSQPRQVLSLIDAASVMVGIVIGSTIYESAPAIAAGAVRSVTERVAAWGYTGHSESLAVLAVFGVWIAGGLLALVGALCYAELATAYQHAGGTYIYLSEAFGRNVGFAFAWAEFWIVRPGNVGAIAFVMASYGQQLIRPGAEPSNSLNLALAAGAIVLLAAVNALGLRAGTRTQNLLTGAKLLGLAAIVLTAFMLLPARASGPITARPADSLLLSMILVMFAYGGWADISFVAAEVRHPERNIARALTLGTLLITAIYLAVNAGFLWALGVAGLTGSQAVAAKLMSIKFGAAGSVAISLLVVVSCLGSINGMMFAGARVFYALGEYHPTFRWLGVWNEGRGVPLRSLFVQTLVTLGLVLGFGVYPGGFTRLVIFTGPFYWGFIGLVGPALILLRLQDRLGSTYRAPLFPLLPLLLAVSGGAMAWSAVQYTLVQRASLAFWSAGAMWAAGVVVAGIIVGFLDWRARRAASASTR